MLESRVDAVDSWVESLLRLGSLDGVEAAVAEFDFGWETAFISALMEVSKLFMSSKF